jgi:hypothetical protein
MGVGRPQRKPWQNKDTEGQGAIIEIFLSLAFLSYNIKKCDRRNKISKNRQFCIFFTSHAN